MNYVTGQDCLCTVYHKEWCKSGGAIRSGPQPLEYRVDLLYPVRVRFHCPADRARLLFLRTCALEVSHELRHRARLPLHRIP